MEYIQAGGYIDLTASYTPAERPGSLTVLESLKRLIRAGIPLDHVTMSSDSNATRTLPDKRLKYLPIQNLFQVTKELWQRGEITRSQVVRFVTENPAKTLGLGRVKGRLEAGKHADLIIIQEPFELEALCLKGNGPEKTGRPSSTTPFSPPEES